jgi:UTP--glucose-1-phosphate uridylyltransferase
MSIKKAIIPIAGLGTRFLPLSKVLTKEFWPLADSPVIEYIVREAVDAGAKRIIFVVKPGDRKILNYFKKDIWLERNLKQRKKKDSLKTLADLEKISKKISFSFATQKNALGDGHAVLQARKLIKNQACFVLFGDDVVYSETSCAKQLGQVYNKYQKPVIALCQLPKEKLGSYGIVKVKKIGPRLFQIKDIVEKPEPGKVPSDLAIVGKYVINSDVFNFLEKSPCQAKGEIRLAGAFKEMIKNNLPVYGYQFKGKWLECGNKTTYLKSNFYISLKHAQFSKELKKMIKQEKLI